MIESKGEKNILLGEESSLAAGPIWLLLVGLIGVILHILLLKVLQTTGISVGLQTTRISVGTGRRGTTIR